MEARTAKTTLTGRWSDITGYVEVPHLISGLDFRRPEYRRAVFLRFYDFHLRYRAHPGCVYYLMPWLAQYYGWNMEQRLWFAFINGNTQNPITSLLIFQQWPELTLGIALESWFDNHWDKLAFDADRRYQKKLFPRACTEYWEAVKSYHSQERFWQFSDFAGYWRTGQSLYGFGSLAAFSYLEYLHIMGLPVQCDTLFLDDMQGSKSHRNGLAIVLGRDDLDWHKCNTFTVQYSTTLLEWLENEAALLLQDAKDFSIYNPHAKDIGYFTLESTLCTYKSWHRKNRRYPNVYNDMLHDRIRAAEYSWPTIDFSMFWQARRECLPAYLRLENNPLDPGLCPAKQNHYLNTGEVIGMGLDWPEFRNHFDTRWERL